MLARGGSGEIGGDTDERGGIRLHTAPVGRHGDELKAPASGDDLQAPASGDELKHLKVVTSEQVQVLTGIVGESSHGGAAALPFSSRTSADALRVALRSEIGQ